ncbi:MAG: Phosphohistidine phosphatase SixA [Pseudomonadota bacterium]|jgi:phosphohistidine phosphatase
MDLIFWRHADALDAVEGQEDLLRALSSKGEKQASKMGTWLDRQLPEGVRVMCSPATRAEQTARTLGRKYKLKSELLPDALPVELLEAVGWPHSKMSVVVVGHQPVIGQCIAYLLGMPSSELPIRKGAVWWLRSRVRDGVTQTVVVCVQTPELI